MLVKISSIPPNKDYIIIHNQHGQRSNFPRSFARHVRTNDICMLTEYRGRPQLKLLTDDDERVVVSNTQNTPPAIRPPEPIPTP